MSNSSTLSTAYDARLFDGREGASIPGVHRSASASRHFDGADCCHVRQGTKDWKQHQRTAAQFLGTPVSTAISSGYGKAVSGHQLKSVPTRMQCAG